MDNTNGLSAAAVIDQLASIHFSLDKQLNLLNPSSILRNYLKVSGIRDSACAGNLFDIFKIIRPGNAKSFADIYRSAGAMVLMVEKSEAFAIRGQFIQTGLNALTFVGAPWLAWMNQVHPDKPVPIGDFKAWDPQLDQVVLLSTERQNIADLELLAGELRRAKEVADDARQSQADFFAIMSHEMRTPLTGVVTALSLIDVEEFKGRARRMLEIANMSALNLRSVVNQVLDYSKLQAGGFSNDVVEFNVTALIESVVSIMEPKSKAKDVPIIVDYSDDLYEFASADAGKLTQVLLNILNNALKFTEEGSIRVAVSMALENEMLQVSVADTGEGIAPENRDRIFKPFLTYSPIKGDEESGTGLGLSIASRFIQIMNGNIHFDSELGVGTKFTFNIPVQKADGSSIDASQTLAKGARRYSGKVLLVEDNEVNQFLGQLMLEDRGLIVETANNGQEALDKIAEAKFDLVFMDISMPVMDGISATQCIRKIQDNNALVIIAMTAHVGNEFQEKFMACGMNGVLHKPVDTELLDNLLSKWLPHVECLPKPTPVSSYARLLSDVPLLDKGKADKLRREIGDSGYGRFCQLLSEDLDSGVSEIMQSMQASNLSNVSKVSHRLKSSTVTIGLMALHRVFNQLEQLSKVPETERAVTEAAELVSGLDALASDSFAALNALTGDEDPHN